MCGIAGVVSQDLTQRSPHIVHQMLSVLSHRGPDDEGVESLNHATLGARRLAIIDLAGGHQPMSNARGDVLAVQNGEIYNFNDLRRQLENAGHVFHTRSDTEVLPHAYDEWGLDFVSHLRGMFALALWDGTRRRLVLARDRFGKKPLMYAHKDGSFLFGSEIQAVLAHPLVSRDVDADGVGAYLALGYVPPPLTGFAEIRKVCPAQMLVVEDGRITSETYWELRYLPKHRISFADAATTLRDRIDEAVQLRLISDVPLGAFLSGGLDSSTVVALMAQHSASPVKTFSIGFKDQAYDELRYARLVASRFGTDHHEFVVDASDTEILPALVRHVGEPFADSSIVPTYHVARLTRTLVTVALTGDGGDELFGGYNHYRAVAAANRLARLPRPLLTTLAAVAGAISLPPRAPRPIRLGLRFSQALSLGRAERYLKWTGHFYGDRYRSIAGERLDLAGAEAAESTITEAMRDVGSSEAAEQEMGADIRTSLPGDLLVKMDIATMANSLEARSPLLDHELAEFVARLPSSYKFSLSRSKLILRSALKNDLPDQVLRRGKMGFSAPVSVWIRGPLRDLFADVVASPRIAEVGFVSSQEVKRLFAEHLERRADNTRLLWNLLMLELWFRECVEGRHFASTLSAPFVSPAVRSA